MDDMQNTAILALLKLKHDSRVWADFFSPEIKKNRLYVMSSRIVAHLATTASLVVREVILLHICKLSYL